MFFNITLAKMFLRRKCGSRNSPKMSNLWKVDLKYVLIKYFHARFFASFLLIKLALTRAAQLSILFVEKISNAATPPGTRDNIRRRKKPRTHRIRTHIFSILRQVLHNCATTTSHFQTSLFIDRWRAQNLILLHLLHENPAKFWENFRLPKIPIKKVVEH